MSADRTERAGERRRHETGERHADSAPAATPSALARVEQELRAQPRRWLVTGAAGFIGSHLVERLLECDQEVRGLDDFSTGTRANLEAIAGSVASERWRRFTLVEGDVRSAADAGRACAGIELVLHQAALGSVPRSLLDPALTLSVNAQGTWTVLDAARRAGVERVVLASSSSVYGDSSLLPEREDVLGRARSPYAASKQIAELCAQGFARGLGLSVVALRYFNVFGPRQNPAGPYAAVIARWIAALLRGEAPVLHGDGTSTRDFTPVAAVVAANLLAARCALAGLPPALNVGTGRETSLAELFELLLAELGRQGIERGTLRPRAGAPRPADRRRSRADLTLAQRHLGYEPPADLVLGLRATVRAQLQELVDSRGGAS